MPTQETVQGREMLNHVSKRQKAVKKLKFEQMDGFLNRLLKASIEMLEKCSISRIGYDLKSILGAGGLELNRWNRFSINMSNSGLICARDFNSFKNKSKNIFLTHKIFDRIHTEQSRKHFLKRSFMTKCKLPPSNKPAPATSYCYSTMLSLLSLQSYPLIVKYILPSLSCHHKSVSLKCQNMPHSPLRFVLYPKSIKKLPFPKVCHEKCSQSLKCPESLKSSTPSSKYLKSLKYLLKRKLPDLCRLSSCPTSYPHSFPQCSQDSFKNIRNAPKRFSKSQRNKIHKTSIHRGPCYPISLRKVHWRGFHSSLFSFAKSDSNKPSACKKMDNICKPTEVKKTSECGQPCKEKSDVCRQEKVKCDRRQQHEKEKAKVRQKPKTEKKIADAECRKTCLPIGKCELPRTVTPPKMEYAKVTCPPPKFAKPNPCPTMLEYLQKNDKPHIETKQIKAQKKQICAPPSLPKPPYAPVLLCPCPPPRKVHPGPCPCYEMKEIAKQPSIQPCPLKKKYPCPTGIHYCSPQKKPCNLKRESGCEHRKKKAASAS